MAASSDQDPAVEITFGRHCGVFDGERAVITVHGVVTESDAAQMMDFILRWDARAGNLGMVLRAPESFSVTPEARKYFVRSSRVGLPAIPMAVMGTSAIVRGILTLLINAMRITLQRDVPVRFCSTDEEALSWLSDQMKLRAVQLANMKVIAATPKS